MSVGAYSHISQAHSDAHRTAEPAFELQVNSGQHYGSGPYRPSIKRHKHMPPRSKTFYARPTCTPDTPAPIHNNKILGFIKFRATGIAGLYFRLKIRGAACAMWMGMCNIWDTRLGLKIERKWDRGILERCSWSSSNKGSFQIFICFRVITYGICENWQANEEAFGFVVLMFLLFWVAISFRSRNQLKEKSLKNWNCYW